MEEKMWNHGNRLWRQQKRRRRWYKAVCVISCFVVFCTTYALILPAITMEKTTYCGKEEHRHEESCYTKQIICELPTEETIPGHTHTEECYQHERILSCGLEESEGHIHTESCWQREQLLTCAREGEEGHVHEESCYTTTETLICGQQESWGHIHTDDCYTTVDSLICGQEERPETVAKIHEHTAECYETVLTCSLEEHTHSLACYSDHNADLETAAEWESRLPALTGDRAADLVLVAESQLGYKESKANYEVMEDNSIAGYTRYGAWYGNPYGAWSGMFVSFCMNYANIPQSVFPYDADCQRWADTLAQWGRYVSAGDYMPKAGDIVFLDLDEEQGIDHAGIVKSVSEEGTITTVEGDSKDEVRYGSYGFSGGNIVGYGVLPEEHREEAAGEHTENAENPGEELEENRDENVETAEGVFIQTDGEPKEEAPSETEKEQETGTEPGEEEELGEETQLLTMTAEGDDYIVNVSYTEEAEIPEGAELQVREIEQESEEYENYYRQVSTVAQNESKEALSFVQFFDLTFIVDGEKVEPTASVDVTITYENSMEIAEEEKSLAVNFSEKGPEMLNVQTENTENGGTAFTFTQEKFSTCGIIIMSKEAGNKKYKLSYAGDDYSVEVFYSDEAGISEDTFLYVHELEMESDAFLTALEEANAILQADSGVYIKKARFFDISIVDENQNEIEPSTSVNVKIILNNAEQTTEDMVVTHTDDAGTSVIENVEASKNNGDVIACFEAEGFSTYGVTETTQAEPGEVAVGKTAVLEGTEAKYHSWTSSNTNVAAVSGTGSTGIVTGIAASDDVVTIIHAYGKNKNSAQNEYYYLRVTSEATEDSTLTSEMSGYTVTIKGNKKILEKAKLFVEEINPELSDNIDYYAHLVNDIDSSLSMDVKDKEKIFDFLKMYHIYLSKDDGKTEYDPSEDESLKNININLQVTITYDSTPEGWPSENRSLYIGHYKKNAAGIVENKGFTESVGIKQVKVSGNSITFHIQGFSVIGAGALGTPENSSSSISGGVELHYSSGTLSAGDINGYDDSGKNKWGVSTAGAYQSVNGTRIVKYVEPTNIEDVFKVTVAVERTAADEELEKIISAMPAFIINENKNKVDSEVGTILEPKEYQNGDCYGSTDESKALDKNDYFYVHYQYTFTEDGKVVTKDLGNVKMYRAYGKSAGQNHGIIGILPNGKWIVIDTNDFKWSDHDTHNVSLSQVQYEALVNAATPEVSVNGVRDYLNTDRFIYLGNVAADTKETSNVVPTVSLSGTLASVPQDGIISWSGDGWESLAVGDTAKMSYYVRLITSTVDGASSDIIPMKFEENGPVNGTGIAYELANTKTVANVVARQAVIENNTINQKSTECTIETSQPSVKGLLYYIQVEKVDSEDKEIKLKGAEFDIYFAASEKKVATIVTDEYGRGISSPGLPWGTYRLVEGKAPSGYTKTWEGNECYLAYLGNNSPGNISIVDTDKPGKNFIGDDAITNTPVKVKFVKKDSSGNPLANVEFDLYKGDGAELLYSGLKSDENGNIVYTSGETTISEFPLRTGTIYYLKETKGLEGFEQLDERIKISIDTTTTPSIVNAVLEKTISETITVTPPADDRSPYILTVTNARKEIPVTFVKVGMKSGETDITKAIELSGAQFELYKVEGENEVNLTESKLISSSSDGTGIFSASDIKLETGSYVLVEKKAPDGYYQIVNKLYFRVDAEKENPDEIITTTSSLSNINISHDLSGEETTYTVKVINRAGAQLPETGGTGTLPYTLCGLSFVLAALMYGYTMRRRKDKEQLCCESPAERERRSNE